MIQKTLTDLNNVLPITDTSLRFITFSIERNIRKEMTWNYTTFPTLDKGNFLCTRRMSLKYGFL